MKEIAVSERAIFPNLVIVSGRDPGLFTVALNEDGQVEVRSPHRTATYAPGNWLGVFATQLYGGHFDAIGSAAHVEGAVENSVFSARALVRPAARRR